MLIRLYDIVDDRLCYEKVRELRWSEGISCPYCGSSSYRRLAIPTVVNIGIATIVKPVISMMI